MFNDCVDESLFESNLIFYIENIFTLCGRSTGSSEPEKKTLTFQYTGCLIGILIMVYSNPDKNGLHNPLYTLSNQGPFFSLLN